MSETKIQVRRRGRCIIAIRIQAASLHEALSKLSAAQTADRHDWPMMTMSKISNIKDEGNGWWIVSPS